ncbi:outer membrane beta-barrel protein [Bacteroides helcogenes]|uniref:Outer membrane protein beta-barrel domain-containing protein n=1 Tax=Bacteroides helcogenes (strain ATCC 35417 / DSM 20613 / JCM 6297 / CCUG 15421 / P 36-108) TaxID=693979 RepID=E6SVT2_BACT6|nr:outer membrane beta-barrel protein [Bacteroides helcogenes]ADV44521.1 hypothetical protein Bache_2563 [Bacteroides helcogenes P 36-108]MDY5239001.1 outer membrane beta-barrel protein [Bacteroides helcogenes]
MKKIVLVLFALMAVVSVNAQVYVGGTLGLWHNDDADMTNFSIAPEIGYNINKKWAVGAELGYVHSNTNVTLGNFSGSVKTNAFAIAPYARYSFYENKLVRLFIDGGLGFSTYKVDVDGADATNGFEIGVKPGLAIKLNNHFSLVAKCGFLGYRDDYMVGENGYGFALTSENLSFGFHYEF